MYINLSKIKVPNEYMETSHLVLATVPGFKKPEEEIKSRPTSEIRYNLKP